MRATRPAALASALSAAPAASAELASTKAKATSTRVDRFTHTVRDRSSRIPDWLVFAQQVHRIACHGAQVAPCGWASP
ncbi:hypothetical protein GCM10010174_52800 [Kutzneria viridogrisea]